MIGTLFSLLVALFIYLNPVGVESLENIPLIAATLLIISGLFVFIQTLLTALIWNPLQRGERDLTPRSVELFSKDRHLKWTNAFLLMFVLITFVISVEVVFFDHLNKMTLLAGWVVLFGFAIDTLHHFFKRIMSYLDPYKIVQMLKDQAFFYIKEERELDLCRTIDALSDTTLKALHRHTPSLSVHTLKEMSSILDAFLEASKSITHHETDEQTTAAGIQDKVRYTMFYVFDRIEYIHSESVLKQNQPICIECLKSLGKATISAAKYDISLADYPIHYFGKLVKAAQKEKISEVGELASCTLIEVSRTITTEVNLEYLEIQDAFLSIITYMHEIAKEMFRQDKSRDLNLLMQPFYHLKTLFETDKMKAHRDTATIVKSIDAVLEEFLTLLQVLQTMPPLPTGEKKETSESEKA